MLAVNINYFKHLLKTVAEGGNVKSVEVIFLFELTDINECDEYQVQHPYETVCLNNGTCKDIINGFFCECKQIDEDLIIFGDRCEKST